MVSTLTQRKILSWLTLLRFGATARGVLPFLLGATIAWSQGNDINIPVLVLSSVTVLFIMLMTFLINEYYDYETDMKNRDWHQFSGGSRILPMGLVRRDRSLMAAHVFLFAALTIGLFLNFYYRTGPLTIPLGIAAIFIGYAYTARPLQLSYRGLGEVAILFACGWLATIAGYYLQTGHFDSVATLASIPGAISVFLVILINEVPDINSDRLSGKNNLAVRLGREKVAILYVALLFLCILLIIIITFFGVPLISAILSAILIPFMIWNIITLKRRGLNGRDVQEGLSLRTVLFDHLITIIYAVAFVIAGLKVSTAGIDLWVLAIAFLLVFALEGMGIVCSRIILEKE